MAWIEKAADSFTRANAGLTVPWYMALYAVPEIKSNRVGAQGGGQHYAAYHSTVLADMQYVKMSVDTNTLQNYDYMFLRYSGTGGFNCYSLQTDGTTPTTYYFSKWTNGSQSNTTWTGKQSRVTYPTMMLTAEGSTITAYYWTGSVWTSFGSGTDSSFTSGKAGVGCYRGAGAGYYIYNWSAGDNQAVPACYLHERRNRMNRFPISTKNYLA